MEEAMKLALEALRPISHNSTDDPRGQADKAIKAVEEALAKQGEPVGWPCLIAETNFSQNTVTLTMQCEDYKVSAKQHWLSTTPQQRTWVGLTKKEVHDLYDSDYAVFHQRIEAKLRSKNEKL